MHDAHVLLKVDADAADCIAAGGRLRSDRSGVYQRVDRRAGAARSREHGEKGRSSHIVVGLCT